MKLITQLKALLLPAAILCTQAYASTGGSPFTNTSSGLNPLVNPADATTSLPTVEFMDKHHVNIMTALPALTFPIVSIGNDQFNIDFSQRHLDVGFVGPVLNHGGVAFETNVPEPGHEVGIKLTKAIEVQIGFGKYYFFPADADFIQPFHNPENLQYISRSDYGLRLEAISGGYKFIDKNGTQYYLNSQKGDNLGSVLRKVISPNGLVTNIKYYPHGNNGRFVIGKIYNTAGLSIDLNYKTNINQLGVSSELAAPKSFRCTNYFNSTTWQAEWRPIKNATHYLLEHKTTSGVNTSKVTGTSHRFKTNHSSNYFGPICYTLRACKNAVCGSPIAPEGSKIDESRITKNELKVDSLKFFYTYNPYKATAVNNAYEYCGKNDCNYVLKWPAASFEWSNGYPKWDYFKSYDGEKAESDYVIKNLNNNKKIEIKHELIQLKGCKNRSINDEPRIKSVKYSKDKKPSIVYEYEQYENFKDAPTIHPCSTEQKPQGPVSKPLVKKSIVNGRAREHSFPFAPSSIIQTRKITWQADEDGGNRTDVEWVSTYGAPERFSRAGDGHSFVFYTADQRRNFGYSSELKWWATPSEGAVALGYDHRSNVTKKTQYIFSGANAQSPVVRAELKYPETCTNTKTCNKPTWIKDAKGNKTDYTYHPASGQIATITYPADSDGIRPQTRFKYLQKYAYYIQDVSKKIKRAPTPIWVLTEKSECQSSNAKSGGGCQKSDDEIKTLYDYGQPNKPNNLFLKGVTIVANGKSRKICYQYDKYGNNIGETEPKANLASCP